MSKRNVLLSLLVLTLSGVHVQGQGTPISFYKQGIGTNDVIVGTVPTEGFVLTDVISAGISSVTVMVAQSDGVNPKTRVLEIGGSGIRLHLQTGIPFIPGNQIIMNGVSGTDNYTICGYIPAGSGTVPAVSTWGVLIMLALVIVAGTVVFRRVKVPA